MAHRPLPRRINSSLRWLITSRCRGRFEAPSDLRTPQSLGSTSVFIRWILCQSPTPHRCRVICLRASAFPKPFWLGLWLRILRNYLARPPATRSQSLAWSTGSIPSAPQPISRATSRSLEFRERQGARTASLTTCARSSGFPSVATTRWESTTRINSGSRLRLRVIKHSSFSLPPTLSSHASPSQPTSPNCSSAAACHPPHSLRQSPMPRRAETRMTRV